METLFWLESKEEGICYWYVIQVENKSTKNQVQVLYKTQNRFWVTLAIKLYT
jgi:hypothetical protein